jgi:hypothetical protein
MTIRHGVRSRIELATDEEDGSIVVQKMSELADKSKKLGFAIVEAEAEKEHEDHESEEEEEERQKEREEKRKRFND